MARQTEAPGAALRSLRRMSGMTLKEVAFVADTSISYLSKVERGEFAPSQDYVAKVAFEISRSMLPRAREKAA